MNIWLLLSRNVIELGIFRLKDRISTTDRWGMDEVMCEFTLSVLLFWRYNRLDDSVGFCGEEKKKNVFCPKDIISLELPVVFCEIPIWYDELCVKPKSITRRRRRVTKALDMLCVPTIKRIEIELLDVRMMISNFMYHCVARTAEVWCVMNGNSVWLDPRNANTRLVVSLDFEPYNQPRLPVCQIISTGAWPFYPI
jgi:hypothetical protein